MSRSLSIWIVALMMLGLAIFLWPYSVLGAYVREFGVVFGWFSLLVSVCSATAAIGLLLERSWSAYPTYGVALCTIGVAVWAILAGLSKGLPYADVLDNVIAFVPAATLLALGILAIVIVGRHRRRL